MHTTWAPIGNQPKVPVTGARKSVKVYGAVNILRAEFEFMQTDVFNAVTYWDFLEQLARKYSRRGAILIQDNASYHKDGNIWLWFKENRKWLEVYNLPPYSPELNAQEPIWKYTRKTGTHNRFFENVTDLEDTLYGVFEGIQKNPKVIHGYLAPFI